MPAASTPSSKTSAPAKPVKRKKASSKKAKGAAINVTEDSAVTLENAVITDAGIEVQEGSTVSLENVELASEAVPEPEPFKPVKGRFLRLERDGQRVVGEVVDVNEETGRIYFAQWVNGKRLPPSSLTLDNTIAVSEISRELCSDWSKESY